MVKFMMNKFESLRSAVCLSACAALLCAIICSLCVPEASAWVTERRRPQFLRTPGHVVVPAPYSLNGIGQGIALFGSANNIADTYADLYGLILTGDLKGYGGGFTEFHIIDKRLFLDFSMERLDRAIIQSYSSRGMNTDKDDYIFVDLDKLVFNGVRMNLSYMDRMLEFYAIGYSGSSSINSLRDTDGNVIVETSDSSKDRFSFLGLGFLMDFTDDYNDPRRGVRLDTNVAWSPTREDLSAKYYVLDNNLTMYLPVGKISTLALNYFQSDAIVTEEGETDRTRIYDELGFQCHDITDPEEQAECYDSTNEYINNVVAANKYGTSTSLGGRSRLRSFAEDRYKGAHTAFLGTELRWNLIEETTPFDFFIMKDIRTGIQLAFFHEIGTVAERQGDLWKESRSSTGIGARIATASGLIYRVDYATGKEGESLTIIINYPWEAF